VAVDFETMNKIAKNYAEDVKRIMPVDRAVLFGSYAKGTADEQSDVDICFFLKNFGNKPRVDILTQLLNLAGKYKGVFFEPIAFPTSEIQRGNPFVKEILSTGHEV
jgi:predicted nucleotidyltransferase